MEELRDVIEVGRIPFNASNISEDGDEEDSPVVNSVTSHSTYSNYIHLPNFYFPQTGLIECFSAAWKGGPLFL